MKKSIIWMIILVLTTTLLGLAKAPLPVSAASAIDGFNAWANGSVVKSVALQP